MKRLLLILFVLFVGCSFSGRLHTDYFGKGILLKQQPNGSGDKYVFLKSVKKDVTEQDIYFFTFMFCEDFEPDYTIELREYIKIFALENGYRSFESLKSDKKWFGHLRLGIEKDSCADGVSMKRHVVMVRFKI